MCFGEVAERARCEQANIWRVAKATLADAKPHIFDEALPRKFGEVAERLKAAHC